MNFSLRSFIPVFYFFTDFGMIFSVYIPKILRSEVSSYGEIGFWMRFSRKITISKFVFQWIQKRNFLWDIWKCLLKCFFRLIKRFIFGLIHFRFIIFSIYHRKKFSWFFVEIFDLSSDPIVGSAYGGILVIWRNRDFQNRFSIDYQN